MLPTTSRPRCLPSAGSPAVALCRPPRLPFRTGLLAALAFLAGPLPSQTYQVGDIVDNFTLTNRATGQPASLHDFAGRVIFLEWFAYWCPFCQAAAERTTPEIDRYYVALGGNAHGVSVVHVHLNVQGGAELQTQGFIDSEVVLANDNWAAGGADDLADAFAQVGAFPLGPGSLRLRGPQQGRGTAPRPAGGILHGCRTGRRGDDGRRRAKRSWMFTRRRRFGKMAGGFHETSKPTAIVSW